MSRLFGLTREGDLIHHDFALVEGRFPHRPRWQMKNREGHAVRWLARDRRCCKMFFEDQK